MAKSTQQPFLSLEDLTPYIKLVGKNWWTLVAFVVLVLINSLGVIPQVMVEGMTDLSRWCLVTAIAALGIKTSFQKLAVVGWKPVILMVAETVFLLGLVLVCLYTGIAEW